MDTKDKKQFSYKLDVSLLLRALDPCENLVYKKVVAQGYATQNQEKKLRKLAIKRARRARL